MKTVAHTSRQNDGVSPVRQTCRHGGAPALGDMIIGSRPARDMTSAGLIGRRRTRTSTSPGPGFGTGFRMTASEPHRCDLPFCATNSARWSTSAEVAVSVR